MASDSVVGAILASSGRGEEVRSKVDGIDVTGKANRCRAYTSTSARRTPRACAGDGTREGVQRVSRWRLREKGEAVEAFASSLSR